MWPRLFIPKLDVNLDIPEVIKYIEAWKLRALGIPRTKESTMDRERTKPGEILVKDFLEPMNVSVAEFANHLGYAELMIQMIIDGVLPITCRTALLFSRALGTTPEFWLNAQIAVELQEIGEDKLPKSMRTKAEQPHD
jgi:addiction module HigA family antidote